MAYTKTVNRSLTNVYWIETIAEDSTTQRIASAVILPKTRTGYSNPLWRKQVKAGVQAATAMSGKISEMTIKPADAVRIVEHGATRTKPPYGFITWSRTIQGNYFAPGTLAESFADSSVADNQARSRLFAAIRQQRAQVQAGVTAGEFGETIRGLRYTASSLARLFGRWHTDSLKRIASHYRHLGRLRIDQRSGLLVRDPAWEKQARRAPTTWEKMEHELREGWLNFALGIRPLVKDVKDLAETLARWNSETEHRHQVLRGFGQSQATLAKSVSQGNAHTIPYIISTHRWEEVKVIYRAKMVADVGSPATGSAQRLAQLLGAYDFENWVPTIWNLLPMSFVVDYVTNMADVVTCMLTDTSRISWIVKTVVREHNEQASAPVLTQTLMVPDGSGDGKLYPDARSGTLGGYDITTRTIDRSTPGSLALPELTFNLPSTEGLAIPNLLALFVGRTPTHHLNFHT